MTFVHGKHTFVSVNGIDLSRFTKTTSFEDSRSTHDVTTYGPTRERKSFAAGLGEGKCTIAGVHDNTTTPASGAGPRTTLKPLMAAGNAVEFIFRPEGTGSGKQQSIVDDMIQWTCELTMTGDPDEDDQT